MNETLHLLTTRRSCKQLSAPAPDDAQLELMLQAATQVPDHGRLTPWRFVVVRSAGGLARFAALLADTVAHFGFGADAAAKAERVGGMAPLVVAVIASPRKGTPESKPEWEQLMSAGCAAYALQLAAKAQGFDNVWITGMWVNSPLLREAFACGEQEKIIGLMMVGTAQQEVSKPKNTDLAVFTEYW